MHVSSILGGKDPNIISVTPDEAINNVADILRQHRIGAVLVLRDTDDIAGILSERDIVRGVAEHGTPCLNMAAKDLMTAKVVTCTPKDSIDQVMEMMTDNRIRHLPVAQDGKLVGMISIGDVVKHKILEVEQEAEHMRSYIATA